MKILLIPSAVLIPKEMQKKFGKIPAALYPLGKGTILEYLCKKYQNHVDSIYVVASKKAELIQDYVQLKKLPIKIVIPEELHDLGYTIMAGMNAIEKDYPNINYLYINFADTLLDDPILNSEENNFYYASKEYEEEWTYFEHNNGTITQIIDKLSSSVTIPEIHKLFVGVFGIANPQAFSRYIKQSLTNKTEMDSFYQALQNYSKQQNIEFHEAKKWFDVGHAENYYQAKTGVEARSFNSIEIDENRGILKKTSVNKTKLIQEIKWYLKMPTKLQYLIPRIYDYSLELDNPYVSMEYYGYSTLHELLLFGNIPLLKWQTIFRKLLFVVKDMEKYRVSGSKQEIEDSLRNIYITKTMNRLEKMRNEKEFASFFTNEIQINGQVFKSLNYYLSILPDLIEKVVLKDSKIDFNIIHGDLCFSNILIEDNYGFMRLIDPRGKFGDYDIYGDSRYEIAKLLHTLEGNYDFIIEDMFTLKISGTSIVYQVPNKSEKIFSVFQEVFSEKLQDINAIRLIESTLFLSMIPLHSNSINRQYAMLATGLVLLEKVMQTINKNEELN